MSKKRISTHKVSKSLRTRSQSSSQSESLNKVFFAGLSLSGAKTDKTALAFIEYYPSQKKIFLKELVEKIGSSESASSDTILLERLSRPPYKLSSLGISAPLTSPPCLSCPPRCKGIETCKNTEVSWMWQHYKRQKKIKKNFKLFIPYVERWLDYYVTTELEEPFPFIQTLGANNSTLWARAQHLKKHIRCPVVEVNPKVSLWRLGRALNIQKSHLRFHKHSVDGETSRKVILQALVQKGKIFLYEQDFRMLVENINLFDAFLCAVTSYLSYNNQCDAPPKDAPPSAGWIAIPKVDIIW